MLVLSILHNIFLNDEEINRLINKEEVQIVGVNLPVWYYKGNTSEPAEEIFCKYVLTCKPGDVPVKTEEDGYVVNIPQMPNDFYPTNEKWVKMKEEDKIQWALNNPKPNTIENILTEAKGGIELLHFKEYNKIKKDNKYKVIIHIFEIKPISNLIDSLD